MSNGFQIIPIKSLVPSANNYRRSFDQAALDELASSVKAIGIVEPILVRPMGKKFEIVAGHRRHKAALAAGLKDMPAMVRDLTDEEALELQIIENNKENVNPMDEAVGFKRLIEMGKHTPETLAEKIGHSVKYVLARLRLLGLIEDAQDLVAAGEISLGHALVVSRLKNTDDQKKLLEMIRKGDGMTVKEAASRMDSFSSNLADAEFALDGCAACMARTRNQADLFPDLKDAKDECLDRECFMTKTLSHWSEWIEGYAAKGFPVFMDKEDMPAMGYGGRGNGVALIAPSLEGKDWNETVPPKYAAKCAKCKTHHGFYLYATGEGRYRTLDRGEICLSSDCLDEMLKKQANKGAEKGTDKAPEPSGMGEWEKKRAAKECQERFFVAAITAKLPLRPELKQRIEIALLFDDLVFRAELDDFFKEFLPEYDHEVDDQDLDDFAYAWDLLKGIPTRRLDEARDALFRKKMEDELPFLKAVAVDADIDMAADFTIDAQYLEEFEGQDLRELVMELWPGEEERPRILKDPTPGAKDEDIREFILAQDLTGRLPKALIEEAKETPEEEPEAGEGEEPEEGE